MTPNPLKSKRIIDSILDMTARHQERALGETPGALRSGLNWNVVRVKNGTGASVGRGRVVHLSSFDAGADGRQHFLFTAQPSTSGSANRFVVAAEELQTDGYGRCIAAGVALAFVDVTNTDHSHGMATGGQSFASSTFGPCEILSPLTATGDQLCVVRIGSAANNFFLGKVDADTVIDSLATVSVWAGGPGTMADTGRNVSASTWLGAVTAGQKVAMLHDAVTGWLIVNKQY